MSAKRRPAINYCEPIPIEEQVASGPANIVPIGNAIFATLYVDQIPPPELGQERARRICARLVLPRKGAERLYRMLGHALEEKPLPYIEDVIGEATLIANH